tara:strand:- start:74 stop:289 length:216 start_codon:yes stop_codon:yes gene_type:complete
VKISNAIGELPSEQTSIIVANNNVNSKHVKVGPKYFIKKCSGIYAPIKAAIVIPIKIYHKTMFERFIIPLF